MTISAEPKTPPPDQHPPPPPTPASRAWRSIRNHPRISGGVGLAVAAVVVVIALLASSSGTKSQVKTTTPTTQPSSNPIVASYKAQLPALAAAVVSTPNSATALRAYGVALYATGNVNGALTQYLAELKVTPKDAVLLNNLGNVYRDLGQYPKALQSYQSSIAVAPTSATAYINLANLYNYTLRQPALAITTIKDAQTNIRNDPDLGVLLGLAYEQTGNKPAAKTAYTAVLKLAPGNGAATAGLARLAAPTSSSVTVAPTTTLKHSTVTSSPSVSKAPITTLKRVPATTAPGVSVATTK